MSGSFDDTVTKSKHRSSRDKSPNKSRRKRSSHKEKRYHHRKSSRSRSRHRSRSNSNSRRHHHHRLREHHHHSHHRRESRRKRSRVLRSRSNSDTSTNSKKIEITASSLTTATTSSTRLSESNEQANEKKQDSHIGSSQDQLEETTPSTTTTATTISLLGKLPHDPSASTSKLTNAPSLKINITNTSNTVNVSPFPCMTSSLMEVCKSIDINPTSTTSSTSSTATTTMETTNNHPLPLTTTTTTTTTMETKTFSSSTRTLENKHPHPPTKGFLSSSSLSSLSSISSSSTANQQLKQTSLKKPTMDEMKSKVVDVSLIQQNIMKALAQARSAAAVVGISSSSDQESKKTGFHSMETSNVHERKEPTTRLNHHQTVFPSKTIGTQNANTNNRETMENTTTTFLKNAGNNNNTKMMDLTTSTTTTTTTQKIMTTTSSSSSSQWKVSKNNQPDFPIDMFDMFDITHSTAQVSTKVIPPAPFPSTMSSMVDDPNLQSNWDDAEGYYKTVIGEILNNKYQVLGAIGKGVFSTVLKCVDITESSSTTSSTPTTTTTAGKIYAIKLVRNNDTMRKAAQLEQQLLEEMANMDKQSKKYIVKLLDHFEHRNHTALVFEPMSMNLREAMKKFGGRGGIQLNAVRIFAKQLFIALYHLQTCKVIHADIKPDNILVNDKNSYVKLCDFGSAFRVNSPDNLPTPYLVSRYYRAPEIILGFPYDFAIDMWSVGCCLYEMFTGKVLFPGSTNNDMLRLFMEIRGRFPTKMIRRHRAAYMTTIEREPHFEEDCRFRQYEVDRVTGKPVLRVVTITDATKSLGNMLLSAKSASDDRKMIMSLKDLLENMLLLDPSKRISIKEALSHPFVKG